MGGVAELLGRCEFFADLGDDVVAAVAATAKTRALSRNDVVFEEAQWADSLFVVGSGRVAIVKRAADGRESAVALMEAGDVFGEMSLFDGEGRSAEARALDACGLVEVPYGPLRDALASNPTALWSVLGLLARRIRATDETLADSVFLDVPGRTAKRLLELARGTDDFGPAVTQEELAAMVGASRERVNKAISAFVRLGWVEQADRRYRILDRRQLAERAR